MDNPCWYLALNLNERSAALRAGDLNFARFDEQIARRRWERWKSTEPFDHGGLFSERLRAGNLSDEEFLRILGESPETLSEGFSSPPRWVETLQESIDTLAATTAGAQIEEALEKRPMYAALVLVQPLISDYLKRFTREVKRLEARDRGVSFDADVVVPLLLPSVLTKLALSIQRTIVLEINIARVERRLQGNEPSERFQHFLSTLRLPETRKALLNRYPVMARQCVIHLENWFSAGLEFLDRLSHDYSAIGEYFGKSEEIGRLAKIKSGLGDSHCEGRQVFILTFDRGLSVVYKPHPVTMDVHLEEFVQWLNAKGQLPPLSALRALSREDYGWIEFAQTVGCQSMEAVKRFYRRQGSWLAILNALAAVDFHHENLLASGEYPVLVDLETLFHPELSHNDRGTADESIRKILMTSVNAVGLLPSPVTLEGPQKGEIADSSGLGAASKQFHPLENLQIENAGTDHVQISRGYQRMANTHNRPIFQGETDELSKYTNDILSGFRDTYWLLVGLRDELIGTDGQLHRFHSDRVRMLVRNSERYGSLIREGYHPKFMGDALERERLWDHLWLEVSDTPALAPLIASEQRQLFNGDVPYFFARADSRDLEGGDGTIHREALAISGIASAEKKIQQMGEADFTLQLRCIRSSFASLGVGKAPRSRITKPEKGAILSPLEYAQKIGDLLLRTAIREKGTASWLVVESKEGFETPEGIASLPVVSGCLYNGLPGIILFLAHLGKQTRDERYTRLAKECLKTLELRLERDGGMRMSSNAFGAFSGWGGYVYLYSQLGLLWQGQESLVRASQCVSEMEKHYSQDLADLSLDVIGGLAGCVRALLVLDQTQSNRSARTLALSMGSDLLRRSVPHQTGIGWTHLYSQTGFSHGTSGVAWALTDLGVLSNEKRFLDAAMLALDWERSLIGKDHWTDRVMANGKRQSSWCHGAPGVAVSRLAMYERTGDPALWEEGKNAVLASSASLGSLGLCHGLLGNLEPLIYASQLFPLESEWKDLIAKEMTRVNFLLESFDWESLGEENFIDPSLMTGAAGIGYGLLRLSSPDMIPSVLTLQSRNELGLVKNTANKAGAGAPSVQFSR